MLPPAAAAGAGLCPGGDPAGADRVLRARCAAGRDRAQFARADAGAIAPGLVARAAVRRQAGRSGDPLLAALEHWPGPRGAGRAGRWLGSHDRPRAPAAGAFTELAEARGAAFAALAEPAHARCGSADGAQLGAGRYCRAPLAPAEREAALALARAQDWRRDALPRELRPLAVLHGLARASDSAGCSCYGISTAARSGGHADRTAGAIGELRDEPHRAGRRRRAAAGRGGAVLVAGPGRDRERRAAARAAAGRSRPTSRCPLPTPRDCAAQRRPRPIRSAANSAALTGSTATATGGSPPTKCSPRAPPLSASSMLTATTC